MNTAPVSACVHKIVQDQRRCMLAEGKTRGKAHSDAYSCVTSGATHNSIHTTCVTHTMLARHVCSILAGTLDGWIQPDLAIINLTCSFAHAASRASIVGSHNVTSPAAAQPRQAQVHTVTCAATMHAGWIMMMLRAQCVQALARCVRQALALRL